MALAKTAPVETPKQETKPTLDQPNISAGWEGVPLSLYDHFNVDIRFIDDKTIDEMREIYAWAKEGSEDFGDVLRNIGRLELKLGQPLVGDKMHTKLYNWIKIEKNMQSLKKQRQVLEGNLWQ